MCLTCSKQLPELPELPELLELPALHVAVPCCTKGGEDGEGPAPEMSRGGYGGGPQPEAAQWHWEMLNPC